jgi:phosphoglycerate dehydrogenase-like enzyme
VSDRPRALVPWPENRDRAPDDLPVAVYDGSTGAEAAIRDVDLDAVELYVVPYSVPGAFDLISRLPRLRVLQVLTAGYDDALAVLPDGVSLCSGRGLHDASTAEMAVALMLAAQRELPRWARQQEAQVWDRAFTRSLAGCRVLIVGHGSIGRAIEERLLPFGTTVTRLARRARPREAVHPVEALPELLPGADVVVLTLPLDERTRGLFGAAELALLPDDALLVNVGRGAVLSTDALLAEAGRIRAALDVVDPEPLPAGHPLWRAPGVILTPHVAGGSATFYPRARRFVDDQLRRFATGEPLQNLIRDAGPR